MKNNARESVLEDRRRNLEDIIRYARWNALMVKKMGKKWFMYRDKWLQEAFEKDREMWRDPVVRRALLKALRLKSLGRSVS